MNHIPVHKLSEYIDGINDAQEQDAITRHLQECTECQKNLKQLQNMIHLLASLKSLSVNPEFTIQTINRAKKHYSHKRYYKSVRSSFVAAAIVLIAIITMLPSSLKHDAFTPHITANRDDEIKLDCIIPTNMDMNTAMMVLQQNNATILEYSPSYIIVESDVAGFSSIRQIINNYESYRHTIISNVGINQLERGTMNNYPQLSHANKKKYVFRLQLR